MKFREIKDLLDRNSVSQEFDNWYSVSGPGDITLTAAHDGYLIESSFEKFSTHATLSEAAKRLDELSDRAHDLESEDKL